MCCARCQQLVSVLFLLSLLILFAIIRCCPGLTVGMVHLFIVVIATLLLFIVVSLLVFLSPLPGSELVPPEAVRRIETWVDDAQWSLMHEDGQLKVAEVRFSNFSYNRELFSDDSGVHRFELGTFNVTNCMPNTPAVYKVGVVLLLCWVWFLMFHAIFLRECCLRTIHNLGISG